MSLKLLVWNTTKNRAENGDTPPDYRSGQASVLNNATSVSVTFSTALASTNYTVTANFINTTDSLPQFQPVVFTNFSTTGFTATWNAPTVSANYKLNWYCSIFK